MLQKVKSVVFGVLVAAPLFAGAVAGPQGVPGTSGTGSAGGQKLDAFMQLLGRTFNAVIPIMVALALIYFIYGLAEYILESGEAGKKEEGRTRMIYGTIAMFVIASVWGLVYFLQDVLGVSSTTVGVAPSVTMLDQSNLG